jgi:hypothetical protein
MHKIHFVVFGIHSGNGRAGDFSEQFPEGTVIVPLIPRDRKTGPIGLCPIIIRLGLYGASVSGDTPYYFIRQFRSRHSRYIAWIALFELCGNAGLNKQSEEWIVSHLKIMNDIMCHLRKNSLRVLNI